MQASRVWSPGAQDRNGLGGIKRQPGVNVLPERLNRMALTGRALRKADYGQMKPVNNKDSGLNISNGRQCVTDLERVDALQFPE